MKTLITIVIPVYNEAENIQCTLEALVPYQDSLLEVLIVYDTDSDTTIPVVLALKDGYRFPIVLIKNRYKPSALHAIKTGFQSAQGAAVLVMMADMADDFRALPHMIRAYEQGADVVCGSRYMPGGKQIGGPLLKGLMSRVAGLTLYYITGLPTRDVTNSFKLYRRSFLQKITIESSGGFELGMEITAKAFLQGAVITEVPSVWTDRAHGESRFKLWAWLPHYLYWYVLLMIKRGPFYQLLQITKRSIRFIVKV